MSTEYNNNTINSLNKLRTKYSNQNQIPKKVNNNPHTNTNQYNHSNSHPNPNHINTLAPKETEKLNPIRRHSNIYNSYNNYIDVINILSLFISIWYISKCYN